MGFPHHHTYIQVCEPICVLHWIAPGFTRRHITSARLLGQAPCSTIAHTVCVCVCMCVSVMVPIGQTAKSTFRAHFRTHAHIGTCGMLRTLAGGLDTATSPGTTARWYARQGKAVLPALCSVTRYSTSHMSVPSLRRNAWPVCRALIRRARRHSWSRQYPWTS